uniref:Uncharacterized protein n=1 Tax=Anguilla anguilla TaxID=7936 RepID=A0A0E9XXM4_ANGAN
MCRPFKELCVMHSNNKALLVTLIPLIKSTASKLHRTFNRVATQNTTLTFQKKCRSRSLQLFSFR